MQTPTPKLISLHWGYFEEDSKDKGSMRDPGGSLNITDVHLFVIKAGVGRGSNNFLKLKTLKLLLKLTVDQGISQQKVYGDFKMIINRMKGNYRARNTQLLPIQ